MKTQELQARIKSLIRELGWTVAEAARRMYCELHDTDNEDEILRFVEKFKKHISRETTHSEKLERYLKALAKLDEVKKLSIVVPNYIPSNKDLDQSLQKRLQEVSRKLDRDYREDDHSYNCRISEHYI